MSIPKRRQTDRRVRKAIFPVAGLGTRFLPATKSVPKEMLTVVDKPIIQYVVEEAAAAGITDFIFVTGRGKDAIENHFDRPYELIETLRAKGKSKELALVENILPAGCRAFYTRQGEPLGLGHAVLCAKDMIGDEPFAVLLPDDIITSPKNTLRDMIDIYEATEDNVVLAMEVSDEQVSHYGIIDTKGDVVQNGQVSVHGFVEKPTLEKAPSRLAVTGRYVFSPRIFGFLENLESGYGGEIQLTDAMDKLLDVQNFKAYLLEGERFDCGDKFGFQKANIHFALKDAFIGPKLWQHLQKMKVK